MGDPLVMVVTVAVLAVLIVLMMGLGSFAKGGEFNRRNGNRLMRWRVGLQAVAIILIVAVAWARSVWGH